MGRPNGLHVLDHHPSPAVLGPVVVLVHGSLDRATSFARVVRRLGDLHVVTYDRRGYNHSRDAQPPAVSLEDHVLDLVELVGSGPAIVVGHSFGGDVALGAALAAPDSVVAVGAYEPPLPWLDWWPRRPRGSTDEDPGQFAEGFFRRLVGDGSWDRLAQQAQEDRRADGPALLSELKSLRRTDPPFDATAIAVPAVFGRGERSVEHHRRAVGELAAAVPRSELVEIEGAGHGAHLSHPGAFADMVRALVERAVARTSRQIQRAGGS